MMIEYQKAYLEAHGSSFLTCEFQPFLLTLCVGMHITKTKSISLRKVSEYSLGIHII